MFENIPASHPSPSNILNDTPRGTLLWKHLPSRALGIVKHYYVYLPHDYLHSSKAFSTLYLFRGHEREWVNANEDASRKGTSVVDLLDALIGRGTIEPRIVVMPGLSSEDNSVASLGINMRAPHLAKQKHGIGSGAFEDYFVREFIPHIDATYRTIPDRHHRAADGFSLGGYTATMLAIKHPTLFSSVGSYDGTFMWKDFVDERRPQKRVSSLTTRSTKIRTERKAVTDARIAACTDNVWMTNPMFDPVFGFPRDLDYMLLHNPLSLLASIDDASLRSLRDIRFHIQCAAKDGKHGNIDRAKHFVSELRKYGIENAFDDVALSTHAAHDWKSAEEHLRATLVLHR